MSQLGRDPGANARCVVPALVQLLGQPTLAIEAARTLGEFGLESEVSVPALMRCMDSPDPRMRYTAARALGLFGKEAQAAVPVLVRTLNEPAVITGSSFRQDSPVQEAAKDALG